MYRIHTKFKFMQYEKRIHLAISKIKFIYSINILNMSEQFFSEFRGNNFFIISGPCVIESEEHCLFMAKHIKEICDELDIKYIFKASFDKANRTSIDSFRGLDFDTSLQILKKVKDIYNVPICTDIHETWQCEPVSKVADILQIPAFLCRQTDLLLGAGKTGNIVSIKKGQFCNDKTMTHAYEKVLSTGNNKVMLVDRGNMYGYDDLIVDFRNLVKMRNNKEALIVQDITHALQQPNKGSQTDGLRSLIPTIARAAVAVGIDGLFLEVHNDPVNALSDASTQWPLKSLKPLLEELLQIHKVSKGRTTNYL